MSGRVITTLAKLASNWRKPRHRVLRNVPDRRILLVDQCLPVLRTCFAPYIERKHEGIAYLYGQTDGWKTLIVGAFRPHAQTTPGSFEVAPVALAKVVATVCDLGLQVVGQIHSHPSLAGHSQGDEDGARIAYDGFVSIVLPNYARDLPSLKGAAAYMYAEGVFTQISTVTIVPGGMA